jgi:V8-like Glu-specific endopeptidase
LEKDSDPNVRDRVSNYTVINEPDEQRLDVIIGGDDRQQVTNTENFPNSAVAYLEIWDDDEDFVFLCSASFVAPNVLLTAAHCLWIPEFGGWPDGVAVVPGLNGNNEPFGFALADELWVPDGWISADGDINDGYPSDYGLIVLDSNLGNETGQFTINVLDTSTLQAADFQPSTAGYPGDKPRGTQWYGTSDAFEQVLPELLNHDIDAFQGQSGSPIWRDSDLGVVGVLSFETSKDNYARRITTDVIDDLNAACDSMGCDINYVIEGSGPEPSPTPTEEPSPSPTSEPSPSPSPEPSPSPSPSPEPSPLPTATPGAGDLSAFERTWQRTDDPVLNGLVNRTWMWGPAFTAIISEPYDDSPGGVRSVIFHEKSRMEITHPEGDPSSIWYVTNGLIAKELVTGRMQVGDSRFEERSPASINVAGDSNDPNGPTYASFLGLLDATPAELGSTIIATVNRAGAVGSDPALAPHGVTAAHFASETDHVVASVFWDFMNASGLVYDTGGYREALLFESPYFATGLPISEPYWTTVQVGGTERTVLVQVFERRVLTYTPGNPPGWDVEAGNVGLHYYQWRYGAAVTSSNEYDELLDH